MNNSQLHIKNIIKYIIVVGLIYTILKKIPSQKINDKDILIIVAIIFFTFLTYDSIFKKPTEGLENVSGSVTRRRTPPLTSVRNNDEPTPLAPVVTPTTPLSSISQPVNAPTNTVTSTDAALPNNNNVINAQNNFVSRTPNINNQPNIITTPTSQPNIITTPTSQPNIITTPTTQPNMVATPSTSQPTMVATPSVSQPTMVATPSVSQPTMVGVPSVSQQGAMVAAPSVSQPTMVGVPSVSQQGAMVAAPSVSQQGAMVAAPSVSQPTMVATPSVSQQGAMVGVPSVSQQGAMVGVPSASAVQTVSQLAPVVSSSQGMITQTGVQQSQNMVPLQKSNVVESPYANCGAEVERVKKDMEMQMNQLRADMTARLNQASGNKVSGKYFESLMEELRANNMIDDTDVNNIRVKMQSRILTMDEVINSLEMIKKQGKAKTHQQVAAQKAAMGAPSKVDGKDVIYNELPSEYYMPIGDRISNEWDNDFSILNTDKWRVPMPKPPVCINTTPCQVCSNDNTSFSTALKYWDDSRNVTRNAY
jgi:hypothetical protein